jgi:WD40 repeat protein
LGETLDDSSGVVYRASNYPFNDATNSLSGYVCLNNGFTVIPQASSSSILNYNGCVPISGVIDLRETSTLNLLGDIEFDASVTLSNGGHIYGNGKSIILQGNLTIPAGKVVHFGSGGSYATGPGGGTTIRGNGNTIYIDRWAQLFVDTNTTLTISNAKIKFSSGHCSGYPPIRLAAHNSKLALDNVQLDLSDGGNFNFRQGQLFVHNDVVITGTSAFVYQSPVPSFIASGGCLYCDHGTTFSINPATFTDAPYTLKNTYTDCRFINMTDASAALYLNGCSFKTTQTGHRITSGNVICDNSVLFDSNASFSINSFSTLITSTISASTSYNAIASPNGKYIAWGSGNYLYVFKYTGSSLDFVTMHSVGNTIDPTAWSPDGQYIAVGSSTSFLIYILRFDGQTLTRVATSASYGGALRRVVWSPDGRFIAAAGGTTNIRVYAFMGNGFANSGNAIAQTANIANLYGLAWSSDGKFIAAGSFNDTLTVYRFTGPSASNMQLIATSPTFGADIYTISWNPDGRFIAVGGPLKKIDVFQFSGTNFIKKSTADRTDGALNTNIRDIAWSPDGQYIAAMGYEGSVRLYKFLGSDFANGGKHIAMSIQGAGLYGGSWDQNMQFITTSGSAATLHVHPLVSINTSDKQALTNSLVFGDSTKGSAYDATINILPQAKIDLKGKMYVDNVEE